MCARFTLAAPEPALRELIGPADWAAAQTPRWNIAPGQDVLAVADGAAGRRAEAVRWGFPGPDGAAPIVNARFESAATRPLFRHAFVEGRCIVPADAFYEWRGRGGQPYRVTFRKGALFGLAAIRSQDGGLAIVTRAASASLAPIHHRMPVVLETLDAWRAWLGGADGDELDGSIAGDEAAFHAHPVSRRVNSVLNDDPACAAEVAPEGGQLTLW
ncbi:MAG TPA: SOS response-associated peptidase [Longimicrobiales bacterium]|nr:SOS response-associated peptidase [Longimicrobiales bacterium]